MNNTPGNSYIGKECYWIDKVTYKKQNDGKPLGKCIEEGIHNLHKLPIVWFEKSFMGFRWQYKSDVSCELVDLKIIKQ